MPSVRLNFLLQDYINKINNSYLLGGSISNYREYRKSEYRPMLQKNITFISELVFLKIFISWETYLEQTFIRYMCGAETSSGYSPERYVRPKTLDHAFQILKQNKEYLDWTRWDEVKTWSKNFFKDGEPFVPAILSAEVQLNEMKTIRNRITHHSDYASTRFLNLVRDKLGFIPRGITPGKLLITTVPGTDNSVLHNYVTLLITLANIIIR